MVCFLAMCSLMMMIPYYCYNNKSHSKVKINPLTLASTTIRIFPDKELTTTDKMVSVYGRSINSSRGPIKLKKYNSNYYLTMTSFGSKGEPLETYVSQYEPQNRDATGQLQSDNITLVTFQCDNKNRWNMSKLCDLIQWNLKTGNVSKIKSIDMPEDFRIIHLYQAVSISGINRKTGQSEKFYLKMTPPYNVISKTIAPPSFIVSEDIQLTPLN